MRTIELRLSTRGDGDVVDLTPAARGAVAEAGIVEGSLSAFVRGSTAAIATMELEPGGVSDLRALLVRLIPARGDYEHNRLNHDSNSHAHQARRSSVRPSRSRSFAESSPWHVAAARPDRLRRPPSRADRDPPGRLMIETPSGGLGERRPTMGRKSTNPLV